MEASIVEIVWREGNALTRILLEQWRSKWMRSVGGTVEGNRSCYMMMNMVQATSSWLLHDDEYGTSNLQLVAA